MNSALLVGIYPYILKLLPSSSMDMRQALVAIWTYIIAFDRSCRIELVKDKYHSNFITSMCAREFASAHRCMAAFVLCEICNCYRDGQQVCLTSGLHKTVTQLLSQPDVTTSPSLKRWVVLCLGKLCEDFVLAKYMCVTEAGHTQLHSLLQDPCAPVRAAAIATMGELLGASQGNLSQGSAAVAPLGGNGGGIGLGISGYNSMPSLAGDGLMGPPGKTRSVTSSSSAARATGYGLSSNAASAPTPFVAGSSAAVERLELRQAELCLAVLIIERLLDGSAMVRREAVVALSKVCEEYKHIYYIYAYIHSDIYTDIHSCMNA